MNIITSKISEMISRNGIYQYCIYKENEEKMLKIKSFFWFPEDETDCYLKEESYRDLSISFEDYLKSSRTYRHKCEEEKRYYAEISKNEFSNRILKEFQEISIKYPSIDTPEGEYMGVLYWGYEEEMYMI